MQFQNMKQLHKFVSSFIKSVGVKPHYSEPQVQSAIRIFKRMVKDGDLSDSTIPKEFINQVVWVMDGFDYALSTSRTNNPQTELEIKKMTPYSLFKQSVYFALKGYTMADVVYHYNGRTDMLSSKHYPIINKEK